MRFILLFLLLPLFAYAQNSEFHLEDWRTHKFKNTKIEFPSNWELRENPGLGMSYVLIKADSEQENGFNENINLMLQDLSELNYSLEEYVKISVEQLPKIMGDIHLIENRIVAEKLPYCILEYTYAHAKGELHVVQHMWVIKRTAYLLTGIATNGQFDTMEQELRGIMNSFYVR